jgi:hypothetical protein
MISRMKKYSQLLLLTLLSITLLTACFEQPPRLNQEQALDIAWQALQPNTTDQNRGDWDIIEVKRVAGGEVVQEFALSRSNNCPGPVPPDNQAIKNTSEYWYIKTLPHALVAAARKGTITATSDQKLQPTPAVYEAVFLIDVYGGQVVARKLTCPEP